MRQKKRGNVAGDIVVAGVWIACAAISGYQGRALYENATKKEPPEEYAEILIEQYDASIARKNDGLKDRFEP